MADPQNAIVIPNDELNPLIPDWVDETQFRPQPISDNPHQHVYFESDLLVPHRLGINVGFTRLEFDWEEVEVRVAAYLNQDNQIVFRIAPGEEDELEPEQDLVALGGPPYVIVAHEYVLDAKQVFWNEYWGAVRARVGLVKMRLILRSYIQVKRNKRWIDMANPYMANPDMTE